MRKGMKAVLSLALVLCMVFSISVMAFANAPSNDTAQPLFTYINRASATMDKGLLSTSVAATANGTASVTKMTIKLELQKKSSGVYTTVKTWTETYNSRVAAADGSTTTSPLSTYRLKATFTAYAGTKSESHVIYVYE